MDVFSRYISFFNCLRYGMVGLGTICKVPVCVFQLSQRLGEIYSEEELPQVVGSGKGVCK